MPAYDLLVIDLDGTLLNRQGGVSTRNREALDRCREAGIQVLVATGRSFMESREAIDAIGYEGLVIAAGGSTLSCTQTGATVDRLTMDVDIVHAATNRLLAHGHRVLLLKDRHVTGYDYLTIGDADLHEASRWWFDVHPVDVRHSAAVEDDDHPADTLRTAVVASSEDLGHIAAELGTSLADRAHIQHWPAVTSSHATGSATHLLEIFGPGTDKWTMVEKYCREREVSTSRVAAIGDGLNDVRMIAEAGLGIAMGNAMNSARHVADRTTGHHDEDGVAEAVDRILNDVW